MILSLFSLTGCKDEADEFNINTNGDTVLEITIPDIDSNFSTRADDPTIALKVEEEGNIKTLWLLGFPNEEGTKIVRDLSGMTYTTQGEYRVYSINITPGKYNFYLFANLEDYITSEQRDNLSGKVSIEEKDIEGINLNFEGKIDKLIPGNLPMAAFPNKTDIDQADDYGSVNITEGTTNTVDFNLRFLCSKVRHTILFDNSPNGISKDFYNNIIEFDLGQDNAPIAKNLQANTALKYVEFEDKNARNVAGSLSRSIKINKYQYPENPKYPTSASDILFPWNENDNGNWSTSGKKAWQYVTYLPENLSTDDDSKTVLYHPCTISGVEGGPRTFTMDELRRAKMYDIVSPIKTSDFNDEMNEMKLQISDWDLKNLKYELHGPYELIVEKTKVQIVSTVRWTTMGFQTDVLDKQIYFEYPKVNINGEEIDFYYAQVIDDSMIDDNDKKYEFDDEWQKHFRIKINPKVPYRMIKKLRDLNEDKTNTKTWSDDAGNVYKKEDLLHFHLVAGNLHKKIEVNLLELLIALTVSPQTIIIDTREYFTNGWDPKVGDEGIKISFFTNYAEQDLSSRFFLSDPNLLFAGKGKDEKDLPVLQLKDYNGNLSVSNGTYQINKAEGILTLDVKDIIKGNAFWNLDSEFSITFTLKYDDGADDVLTKKVRIIVKPFTSNYKIHFKDETGTWLRPHIFIYQDLLLPSDLLNEEGNPESGISNDAGKIVGYFIYDEGDNDNLKTNAATEYVFSNNISFRGWKGYGGPDINDPYKERTRSSLTEGFVMFGTRNSDRTWNDDYDYTNNANTRNKYGDIRHQRYRYDLNFNEAHEIAVNNKWECGDCSNLAQNHDFNGSGDNEGYPGICMQKETGEHEGWWTYTLTGVAQPGKTMIVFCDTHGPWNSWNMNDGESWPARENFYRFPGANETGLTLFDFEDNEGWFVFKGKNSEGKTDVTDPHFSDDKPN